MCSIEEYKRFFDEAPIALVKIDCGTGQFVMANKFAAKLLDFDNPEEMINHNINEFYPKNKSQDLLNKLINTNELVTREICLESRNGRKVHLKANFKLNDNSSCGRGCGPFVEGCLVDITETIKLKQQQLKLMSEMSLEIDSRIAALAS